MIPYWNILPKSDYLHSMNILLYINLLETIQYTNIPLIGGCSQIMSAAQGGAGGVGKC